MVYNLRKIYAKDSLFIETKEFYKNEHDSFRMFAEELTDKSGRSKSNKSGKAKSYADYLIRLVIFHEEVSNKKIVNLSTFAALKKLESIINSDSFKKYNEKENRFPNATFNCYMAYVTDINSKKENIIDGRLNEELESKTQIDDYIEGLVQGPQPKRKKVMVGNVLAYSRNPNESLKAKHLSNWKCELNSNHFTFISNSNQKPYMEAHHLIPMAAQDYFDNTLDFADNILCLCPNCHRKIHYAEDWAKKEIIKKLFKERENKYSTYDIDIQYKQLLRFYSIL